MDTYSEKWLHGQYVHLDPTTGTVHCDNEKILEYIAGQSMDGVQTSIANVYQKNFGTTPLRQRLEDIKHEVEELCRYTDLRNLKEEAGDALSSLLQLLNECNWRGIDLVNENLTKITKRSSQYRSLGRKIKVAILGGAFDPIHSGHTNIAKFVLNTSKEFDEVWLQPCSKHLYGKQMVHIEHRLEMCKLASKYDGRIKVSDFEARHELAGETYHMFKTLLDQSYAKDQYDFSLIIGLDNANSFDKWVNFEDLERLARFIVVPRKGEIQDPKVTWYLKSPHIYLSPENDIPEISSSVVRNILKHINRLNRQNKESNFPYDPKLENLDPLVLNYILENHLYE